MKKKLILTAMVIVMALTSCAPYNAGNEVSDTDTTTSSVQTEIVTSETEKETRSQSV